MSTNEASQKTAVVLCGIAPHAEFLRHLKRRGYKTVLVDYFSNPPAKSEADIYVQKNAFDLADVVDVAKKYKASFIAAPSIDHANIVCCKASEQLGLPKLYSSKIAYMVTDKSAMKELMNSIKVPTAQSVTIHSIEDVPLIENSLSFPIVVKPADGYASAGVSKVNNKEGLKSAVDLAFKKGNGGGVVAEEWLDGQELSAYCFVVEGKSQIILAADRYTYKSDAGIRCYATFAPSKMPSRLYEEIGNIVQKITSALSLTTTPFFIQFFYTNDSVWVTEFAGRTGGGWSYSTMDRIANFDMFDAIIDVYEGKTPKIESSVSKTVALVQLLYTGYGRIGSIAGIDQVLNSKIVDELCIYKETGDVVDSSKPARARLGTAVLYGRSAKEVSIRAQELMKTVDVYDDQGGQMLLKDICFHA